MEGYQVLPEAEYTVVKARNHDELGRILNESLQLGWLIKHYAVGADGLHFVILARNTKDFVLNALEVAHQLEDGSRSGERAARDADQLRSILEQGLFRGYPDDELRIKKLLA